MDPIEEETNATQPEEQKGEFTPTSLDDIIDGDEIEQEAAPEPKEAPQEPEAEVPPVETKPDDGDGELSDEELEKLPPAERGQIKALKAERTKRQDGERLIAEMKTASETQAAQIAQLLEALQKGPAPVAEKPQEAAELNFYDNPEAYIAKALEGVTGTVQKVTQTQQAQWLNLSEANAKARHEDYDANQALFMEAAKANPALGQAVMQESDPAEAAYQYGAQLKLNQAIQAAGGMEAYIAAQVAAAAPADPEPQPNPAVDKVLPRSMSSHRGVGSGVSSKTDGTFAGPTPLDQILGE